MPLNLAHSHSGTTYSSLISLDHSYNYNVIIERIKSKCLVGQLSLSLYFSRSVNSCILITVIEQLYVTAPNSPGQWKEYNLKYVWNVTRVVYLENILGENVVIEFIKSMFIVCQLSSHMSLLPTPPGQCRWLPPSCSNGIPRDSGALALSNLSSMYQPQLSRPVPG